VLVREFYSGIIRVAIACQAKGELSTGVDTFSLVQKRQLNDITLGMPLGQISVAYFPNVSDMEHSWGGGFGKQGLFRWTASLPIEPYSNSLAHSLHLQISSELHIFVL